MRTTLTESRSELSPFRLLWLPSNSNTTKPGPTLQCQLPLHSALLLTRGFPQYCIHIRRKRQETLRSSSLSLRIGTFDAHNKQTQRLLRLTSTLSPTTTSYFFSQNVTMSLYQSPQDEGYSEDPLTSQLSHSVGRDGTSLSLSSEAMSLSTIERYRMLRTSSHLPEPC